MPSDSLPMDSLNKEARFGFEDEPVNAVATVSVENISKVTKTTLAGLGIFFHSTAF